MIYNTNMFEKRKLKNCIRYYRHHQTYLEALLDTFDMNDYNYAFVGGFVRWVLDKNFEDCGPRDFDIIVDIPKVDLERLLRLYKIPYSKNEFGGFKIPPSQFDTFPNKEIDIWSLEEHSPLDAFENCYGLMQSYGFRTPYRHFKYIPKSSFISLDGATYWVNKNKLYAKDCKKTLKTKEIFITDKMCVNYQGVNRKSLVAKLIHYYHGGYTLNKDCWYLISAYFSKHDSKKVVHWLDKHYPQSMLDWDEFIDEKIYPKI